MECIRQCTEKTSDLEAAGTIDPWGLVVGRGARDLGIDEAEWGRLRVGGL
jgi:hypothetical protein